MCVRYLGIKAVKTILATQLSAAIDDVANRKGLATEKSKSVKIKLTYEKQAQRVYGILSIGTGDR